MTCPTMLGWKVEGRRPTSCSHQPYWCAFFSVTNKNLATTQTGQLVMWDMQWCGKAERRWKKHQSNAPIPKQRPHILSTSACSEKGNIPLPRYFLSLRFCGTYDRQRNPPFPSLSPSPFFSEAGVWPRPSKWFWVAGRKTIVILHISYTDTHTTKET